MIRAPLRVPTRLHEDALIRAIGDGAEFIPRQFFAMMAIPRE